LPKRFVTIIREMNAAIREQKDKAQRAQEDKKTILELRKALLEYLKEKLDKLNPQAKPAKKPSANDKGKKFSLLE